MDDLSAKASSNFGPKSSVGSSTWSKVAMRTLAVRRESIESRDAYELVMALHAELAFRFPEQDPDYFRLDPSDVAPGYGAFVIARTEREPVGCGAVRRIDPGTAEIKRVYVVPKHRGQGVATAILDKLQVIIGELGVSRIVTEIGMQQPDALALFRHAGFVSLPPSEASHSQNSILMQKALSAQRE